MGETLTSPRLVHERFETLAAAHPGSVAVVDHTGQLTYRDLNMRSNQLARLLVDAGAAPGQLVAIRVHRSADLLLSILAVLKTGAGYVPIDPRFPARRQRFMLADAGSEILVSSGTPDDAPADDVRIISLDGDASAIARQDGSDLDSPVSSEDLAYTIHTSGSTGTPKGVMIEHGALAPFLDAVTANPGLMSTDRVLAVTTISFDIAVAELLLPITRGATVVIASHDVVNDPHRLGRRIDEADITMMQATPSAWYALVESGWKGQPSLRMWCGGEAMPRSLADSLLALGGELWNLYGPTEATIWCSAERVVRGPDPVSIGRPFPHVRFHVLDEHRRPVPAGAVGEVYIDGPCLARGYLNQPELTRERFVDLSCDGIGHVRAYRTGDLVLREREDRIIFRGRDDQQVKVRGFRIELAETEAALDRCDDVHQCVVAVDGDGPDRHLVAYLTSHGPALDANRVRDQLRQVLPDYMVPSRLLVLESMPLTPNGKIDRSRLPRPDAVMPAPDVPRVAPRTPTERRLAQIWSDVLGVPAVGVNDSFFELGGHSLRAIVLVSRLRTVFDTELDLAALLRHPTIAQQATLVDGSRFRSPDSDPLPPVDPDRPAPASFGQQRLWYVDQVEGAGAAYTECYALGFHQPLDVDRLRSCFNILIERHPILRTVYRNVEDELLQVVEPPSEVDLTTVDLGDLDDDAGQQELARHLQQEARRPLCLTTGPLLRVTAVRLGTDHHVVLLVLHHICCDDWSIRILFREWSDLYGAAEEPQAQDLPTRNFDYRHFAAWERARSAGVDKSRLEFWRNQLRDATPAHLLTDRPRTTTRSFRGDTVEVRLDSTISDRLFRLAREESASPFVVFLSLFGALLNRCTRQEDLVIGSPVTLRHRAEFQDMPGFFLNTLPFRLDFSGRPTLRSLIREVRHTSLAAIEHADVPLDSILSQVMTARTPLLDVAFAWLDDSLPAPSIGTARTYPIPVHNGAAKFELMLDLRPAEGGGVEGWFEFSTDLFDRATIERLRDHFCVLAEQLSAVPEAPIFELPLVTTEERERLIARGIGEISPYPRGTTPAQLFEARVQIAPSAPAIVCDDRSLTYAELDQLSNRIATALMDLKLAGQTRIAILMDRSIEFTASVIGIMKAGSSYVPLDTASPPGRLVAMMDRAGCSAVICQASFGDSLDDLSVPVLDVDMLIEKGKRSSISPPCEVDDLDEAYVMFTSGSTGEPKGIRVPHRAIVRLAHGDDALALGPGTTTALLASPAFDASTFELWCPLIHGGRIVVIPQQTPTLSHLGEEIRSHAVTSMFLTTGLFNTIIDERPDVLAGVRTILTGGERVSTPHMHRAQGCLPGVDLMHVYGPTEGTTFTTLYRIPTLDDPVSRIPIGRPLRNTHVYILDKRLEPVPEGVPGELWIGGDGLALGYLGDEALTHERFVNDPFAGRDDARMYRSGDLCSWNADGTIEFIGRDDRQLKVRGFRVEPAEIEAALDRCDEVRQCAVAVDGDGPDRHLVAYVTSHGPALDANSVRDQLRQVLPDYMVPSRLLVLESMPLTPNGKIDRSRLPRPEAVMLAPDIPRVAPRTPTEQRLAQIWGDVLRVPAVGVNDSFFDLGGHSLRAIVLVSRLRTVFETELDLAALLRHPTIAQQATIIDGSRSGGPDSDPLPPVDPDRPAPASFGQQRLWYVDQVEGAGAAYTECYALGFHQSLDVDRLRRCFNILIERHPILRTVYRNAEDGLLQVVEPPSEVELRTVDLGGLDDDARQQALARRLRQETRRPLCLTTGPLLRVTAFRLGPDHHVVLLVLHHICCDDWSMRILFREWSDLYGASGEPRAEDLPTRNFDYRHFAAWERARSTGVDKSRLEFWRNQLRDATPAQLLTDRPRTTTRSFRGDTVEIRLDSTISNRLFRLAREESASPFVVFLSLFGALLNRCTRQEDLVIGSPVTLRHRAEFLDMQGFFLNTLPFRLDLSGRPTLRSLVREVRQTSLAAIEHADVPLDSILSQEMTARTPLLDVAFAWLDDSPPAPSIGTARTYPIPVHNGAAKFELMLDLRPAEGGGVDGLFEFSTDLFDHATIERLRDHFCVLAEQLSAVPEAPIFELPLVTSVERERLIARGIGEISPYPRGKTPAQLFEARVQIAPSATAIVCDDRSLIYAELDQLSNRIATALIDLKLAGHTRIAILMDRSIEFAASVIGIMKAGSSYVPLDTTSPPARLVTMTDRAGCSAVICQASFRDSLSDLPVPTLDVDMLIEKGKRSTGNPHCEVDDLDEAYVMFTSGSTGEPKGICVPHRAVVRLAHGDDALALGPGTTTALLASPAFDASTFELWCPLIHGGRIVVIPQQTPTLSHLGEQIQSHAISSMFLTTGLFNTIIDERPDVLAGVRTILTGGERVSTPHMHRAQGCLPGVDLMHVYGPTEGTTFTTLYRIPTLDDPVSRIPIGRPLRNTHVYILDKRLEPVPEGVPGELWIGGDGLALGYLGDEALTHERFVNDPFAGRDDARMYRSGDLCSWNADGTIEFIGRDDRQLKVRGFRVEPAEVEAVIGQHPNVRQCVVLPHKDLLTAYVVVTPGTTITSDELRGLVAASLPGYMVPKDIVTVDTIPLTRSGKTDKSALRNSVIRPSLTAVVTVAESLECELLKIWQNLLRAPHLDVEDNFFEAGGHSLLAMRLLARLERAMQVVLPLNALLQAPTVRLLAHRIRSASGYEGCQLVAVQPRGPDPPLIFVPGIGGSAFVVPELSNRLGPNQPIYAVEVVGAHADASIEQIAAEHVNCIRKVRSEGPYRLVGFSLGGTTAFEMAQQLLNAGTQVDLLAIIDHGPYGRWDLDSIRHALLNVPFWLGELVTRHPSAIVGAARTKLRAVTKRASNLLRSPAKHEPVRVEDIADLSQFSEEQRRVASRYYAAQQRYVPRPYAGRIVLFRARRQPLMEPCGHAMGWAHLARAGVTVHVIPGGHLGILHPPGLNVFADRLREELDAFGEEAGSA